jgi:hypothetical protein
LEWCKLWAEWGTDPKVQSMSESMRCRHALLLCLRCTHDVARLSEDEIAFYMRITLEDLLVTKDLFVRKGFIDKHWNVTKWDKRQASVSPSALRMRALRERERNVLRNGDVTGGATHVRDVAQLAPAEEEEIREEKRIQETPLPPCVTKGSKSFVPPEWIPLVDWNDFVEMRRKNRKVMTTRAKELLVLRLAKFREEGHSPGVLLRLAIERCWQSVFVSDAGFKQHPNGARKPDKSLAEYDERRAQIAAMKAQMEKSSGTIPETK